MAFKIVISFERRLGMSHEECHDYLKTNHAKLVLSVPEFSHYMKGYVQNFADISRGPQGALQFQPDVVVGLWFESPEKAHEAFSVPRYLELIRPDESRFANFTRIICAETDDHLVWDEGGQAGLKLFRFTVLRPDADIDQMDSLYKGAWAEMIANAYRSSGAVCRYVQNWPLRHGQAEIPTLVPLFCIEEFWLSRDITKSTKDALIQDLETFKNLPDRVCIADSFVICAVENVVVEP